MTTPTYALAPSPKWYFLDAQGAPAAGGFIYTYSSLDQTTPKSVYADPAGMFPYSDPVQLDATGGTPVPIYWDTTTAGLYYIVVTDASGNIILALNNFPISGSGGVTPITTVSDVQNHLINGAFQFIDAPTTAASLISPIPVGGDGLRIAPASGFFADGQGGYEPVIPTNISGWRFGMVGGAGGTNSIQFVDVTPIGSGNPTTPSANAIRFFRYTLSVAGAAQTGLFLFQVTPHVETYSGETITVSFEVQGSTAAIGTFVVEQNYGSGGGGSATTTSIPQNFNFIAGWHRLSFVIMVPSVSGKSKGAANDDSVNIKWNFPINVLGTFDITNCQIQRGNFGSPPYIYQTYNQDQYKVLIDLMTFGNLIFRTGDLRHSTNGNAIPGWIQISNGAQTLGSATSGATFAGNQYQNLYLQWWDEFPQAQCAVTGGRGGSAIADFNANKPMTINQDLITTVIAAAGNSIPFATFEGTRAGYLLQHSHTTTALGTFTANGTSGSEVPLLWRGHYRNKRNCRSRQS